jgi:hypothetical protein
VFTENLISQIDTEIRRLQEARNLLANGSTSTILHHVIPVLEKRSKLSPEGRARIAAAQKKRWAAMRRAKKAA